MGVPSSRSSRLSAANAVTLLRLLCAPALAAALLQGLALPAAALFALAVATDLADGWIARRRGETSPFGGALDHAVDAAFVTTGTAALASLGLLPTILPFLIALAFAQYALDSRHLGEPGAGLRPSALGRWNGIAYFVVVGVPVVGDALGLDWPAPWLLGFGWLLVATTLLSMLDRLQVLLRTRRTARPSRARSR